MCFSPVQLGLIHCMETYAAWKGNYHPGITDIKCIAYLRHILTSELGTVLSSKSRVNIIAHLN